MTQSTNLTAAPRGASNRRTAHTSRYLLATTALTLIFSPALTEALPTGGSVSSGSASISNSVNTTTITQTSNDAVINWTGFNTTSGQTVKFNDPNASSITLNRISGSATSFSGNLLSNGNVWLINPQGIAFNKGSNVNVNGLLATTSAITDANFMAGKYNFTPGGGAAGASVTNAGNITVAQAGLAALASPNVSNSGTITASLGRVNLGAGDSYTVDLYGDGLINLAASSAVTAEALKNTGTLNASGGSIVLTAAQASNVVDSLVNLDGALNASNVNATNKGGDIEYGATNSGTTGVSVTASGNVKVENTSINSNGGNITLSGAGSSGNNDGVDLVSATLNAAGGDISVSGKGINSGSGIYANKSTISSTGIGSVTLTGTSTGPSNAYGIDTNNTSVSTGTGALTATGTDEYSVGSDTGFSDTGGMFNSNTGAITLKGSSTVASGNVTDLALNGTKVTSNTGKISLTGTDASSNNTSQGVLLNNDLINSTGAGVLVGGIAISGTSAGAGTTLNGGTIESADGNISVAGTGTTTGIYSGAFINTPKNTPQIYATGIGSVTLTGTSTGPSNAYGIDTNNTSVSTGTGALTATGTDEYSVGSDTGFSDTGGMFNSNTGAITLKGSSTVASGNVTDLALNGTKVTSNTGKISLTGTDASSNNTSQGVLLNNDLINSTGAGVLVGGIAISGTSAGIGINANNGTISTVDGNVTFTSPDQTEINRTSLISFGEGKFIYNK